jgi:hypothetical protein
LTIDFDVSFPMVSCSLLSIDAIDDRGIQQTDAVHELYKHKLTRFGEKTGLAEQSELGHSIRSEAELENLIKANNEKLEVIKRQIGSCGNCYGAGSPGQCCQTCEDVKRAYEKSGWRFKPTGILQCQSEAYLTTLKEEYAEEGGCQIYGRIELSKSSGHFHIAPHKKLQQSGTSILDGGGPENGIFNLMDLISFAFDQFNVSHTINSLSFGEQYPGIKSPLDGQVRSIIDTHGMYQYYIKVVPTRYQGEKCCLCCVSLSSLSFFFLSFFLVDCFVEIDNRKPEIQSNQYSVTEHMSHLAPGSGRGLPGVYFYYEVSPIQAIIYEKRSYYKSFLRFLTSACAIIGGAYTLMGLVDILLGLFLTNFYKESL